MSVAGLAKRAHLADRVDKHDDALEELSHLVLDEVGTNRQSIRRLEEWRKFDHPVLHKCVSRIMALEAKVEQLEARLDADRLLPWWRRPWWRRGVDTGPRTD